MEPSYREHKSPFDSFFMAGFDCASHRRFDGIRLDLTRSTLHYTMAESDYATVRDFGLATIRDGLRWHLIEQPNGSYDWSSFIPMLDAATRTGVQVIWDLFHYGWPDQLDIWSRRFIDRFAAFAAAAAAIIRERTDRPPLYCLINEISYFSWAAGEVGLFFPYANDRGDELKRQLARATIAATDAVRDVDERARFVQAEPAIHVCNLAEENELHARVFDEAQYEAADMLMGRRCPEIGGSDIYLDIVGVNFYPHNQWYYDGGFIPLGHHAYRPLRAILSDIYARTGRTLLVSETGAESTAAAPWFHYVCSEVEAARADKIPVLGVCLYPILDHQGWDNKRHCDVGLLSLPADGVRRVNQPLLAELKRQQILFDERTSFLGPGHSPRANPSVP